MAKRGEQVATQSILASGVSALSETTLEAIHEPGAYVERESGNLYRIPKEALVQVGAEHPAIVRESRSSSVLAKLSGDAFIATFNARVLCAQHNIEPNF